jgi:hypothetical protein
VPFSGHWRRIVKTSTPLLDIPPFSVKNSHSGITFFIKGFKMTTQEQTKKTNGQWYMMLPEPWRMQAMNNAERDDMLGGEASSLGEALCAFAWDAI